jgi:tetratricopeptide (TPR) repeat protein
VEDQLFAFLSLRLGTQLQAQDPRLEGLRGLSSGFGFKVRDLDVDYAYLPFGDLGGVQRLSFSWRFAHGPQAAAVRPSSGPSPDRRTAGAYVRDASLPYDGIVAALYTDAVRERDLGHWTQAADKCRQALSLIPGQPQVAGLMDGIQVELAGLQKIRDAREAAAQAEILAAERRKVEARARSEAKAAVFRKAAQVKGWYNQGVEAWQAGEMRKARAFFMKVLKVRPKDPDCLKAVKKVDQKLEEQKKSRLKEMGALIKEARRLESVGAPEQALTLWDKVLFIDASNRAAIQARENLVRQTRP